MFLKKQNISCRIPKLGFDSVYVPVYVCVCVCEFVYSRGKNVMNISTYNHLQIIYYYLLHNLYIIIFWYNTKNLLIKIIHQGSKL